MTLVLPSTVEELNQLQQSFDISSYSRNVTYKEFENKGFENIAVEKRYKREVSLPNGVENWNISNFDSYLNFEENNEAFKAIESAGQDRLVPQDDSLHRSGSFSNSSVNAMDDKRMFFQGFGVKAFNTICVDSGSTCISSDHPYNNSPTDSLFKGLEAEETYQNLDLFLQQVPEMTITENLPSPLSGTDSSFDIPCLQENFSMQAGSQDSLLGTQDSLLEAPTHGIKRPASTSSDEELFGMRTSKHVCPSPMRYTDVRKKNNMASKNCRKTRKEKQKEMEVRVCELEKEKEGLRVEVQVLEELIQAHKMQLYAILQKR